ncbi:hypothetical protein GPECTOR_12g451 [Gonium pectorale]|uniref:Uncharacterized protein n=1 Tax=Gonium pectorale TaxID=33097 RepID=A0A150GP18_GONPE|nr:hypothetical protein GPECTOR_12g451 [Gonium pectorale]|eukprot:KXZ51488.1 hypothetical protein GPECTOR_12g451 [Gonium pectorale]
MGLAWSPDAALVAIALSNGSAIVWDAAPAADAAASNAARDAFACATEAARFECSDGTLPVSAVGFSVDGSLLFTAVGDGSTVLFTVEGWSKVAKVVPEWRSPTAAGLLGGGAATAAAAGAAGAVLTRYSGAALAADASWVFMGYGREVIMWSVKHKRESAERLGPHSGLVVAVAASPCNKHVAVAAGGSVTVWAKPEPGAGSAPPGTPKTPTTPGGSSGKPPAPFGSRAAQLSLAAEVTGVAFSGEGLLLAACMGDGCVVVWETVTGRWREVGWLAGHSDGASGVAFSPDGRLLLSTGSDGRCLVWSTRDVLAPRHTWSSM